MSETTAVDEMDDNELLSHDNIGQSTLAKIREIINTGKLLRNEFAEGSADRKAAMELQKVWGVGPQSAKGFVEAGCKTREDLAKYKDNMTEMMQIGLTYFDDIQERIPRAEVAALHKHIQDIATELFAGKVRVTVCGSYRRGKETSGDCDCMVVCDDPKLYNAAIIELVKKATDEGFFVAGQHGNMNSFATTADKATASQMKWMGMAKLPGNDPLTGQPWKYHRRVDLIVVKKELEAFSLLYFTGSDYCNRSMRARAIRLGMSLSQNGLRRNVIRSRLRTNGVREKICDGELVPGLHTAETTEQDIFAFFGMAYLTPEQRNH